MRFRYVVQAFTIEVYSNGRKIGCLEILWKTTVNMGYSAQIVTHSQGHMRNETKTALGKIIDGIRALSYVKNEDDWLDYVLSLKKTARNFAAIFTRPIAVNCKKVKLENHPPGEWRNVLDKKVHDTTTFADCRRTSHPDCKYLREDYTQAHLSCRYSISYSSSCKLYPDSCRLETVIFSSTSWKAQVSPEYILFFLNFFWIKWAAWAMSELMGPNQGSISFMSRSTRSSMTFSRRDTLRR